ncbi:MAG: NAD(P)/FAD-dependent oxidoreductase [Dysgonamonadaceae bacterium]|jgi:NADH dehydrogenase|nr:NAD(P)/FAD-dependent oxidoreductase [Dysgonamonadaceae bacterium]
MNTISNIPDRKDLKRIVIVGGGFAGLQLAKKINHRYFQTVLIDKVNYYQFQPLLYQVATAGLEPSSISYPHRKAFQKRPNFHFRTCEALRVLPSENILETSIGSIHFDYLVIATGCDTNYFGDNSLKDSTFALKSISEALLIRNRILMTFEDALNADCEATLRKILTFVVVGGGATGIETAGALADMKKTILPKDYPEIDFTKMEIHLIDASPRLLANMSEHASENATKILKNRGVIIHSNTLVTSYENNLVKMNNNEELYSCNVLWVAGVKANSLPGLPDEAYQKGRLITDEFHRITGFENLFCLGDTALMAMPNYPQGHPMLAQPAIQMAKNLAKNLNRRVQGKPADHPFVYDDRGSLATIGRNAAVADLGKLRFSGRVAWWLWIWIHILSIVGIKNKVFVFLDWAWSYVTYDVSLRLLIKPICSRIYSSKAASDCGK